MRKKDMRRYIYLIFAFFLFNILLESCSTKKTKTGSIKKTKTEREVRMIEEKNFFLENLDITYNINNTSRRTKIFIPQLGKNILVKISLPYDGVNYVKWHSKWTGEDRLLVKGEEYFFDYENKELLIRFNIPHIYFLVPVYKGVLKINGYILSKEHRSSLKEKYYIFKDKYYILDFYWKPAKYEDNAKFSFKFSDNLIKDFDNLPEDIQKAIKEQLKRVDKSKLSKEYKKLIESLERKM